MSNRHTITTSFAAVCASTDTEWLYERAGECDVDPADDEMCPNCLAYLRAQELEEKHRLRHVVVLPQGEANVAGIDGEIIEIDGTHRLIYGTGPGCYDRKQRTGWFWQEHNIGEFWVTMADACGMDAYLARLLCEANNRLRGKFAPGAAYLADEDGNLRGPVTNQELIELVGMEPLWAAARQYATAVSAQDGSREARDRQATAHAKLMAHALNLPADLR